MPDREKVIRQIEKCINDTSCIGCPYEKSLVCRHYMLDDALALLKEQEAVEPKQIIRKQCKKEYEDGSIDYFAEWYCPHCNSLLVIGFDNKWIQFCPRCGKPITWEGR